MKRLRINHLAGGLCAATSLLALAAPVWAGDGRIEINQVIALAGGVNGSLVADPPGFPVTISQSGSYVLTGNLANPSLETDSIHATVGGVTLDLNGFTVSGPRTCTSNDPDDCTGSGAGNGIVLFGDSSVKNGTVRAHGNVGVLLGLPGGGAFLVENVIVAQNGSLGVLAAENAVLRDLVVVTNGSDGIGASHGVVIENCAVKHNDGEGLLLAGATVVRDNSIAENEGAGINSLPAVNGHVIIGNVLLSNAGVGLAISDSVVRDNTLKGNQEPQAQLTRVQFSHNRVDGTADFGLASSGYSNNTMTTVTGAGGIDQGGNVCGNNTTCP
jgi:hypothetical protein